MTPPEQPSEIIRTKINYSDYFRQQVWLVLTDDMEVLGKGYRAYYSYIYENFRVWQSQRIEFQNARGASLNLDALRPDDLHGFIGKKSASNIGPQRRIANSKIAVLHAFFQKHRSDVTLSFEEREHSINGIATRPSQSPPAGGGSKLNELSTFQKESLDGVFFDATPSADLLLGALIHDQNKVEIGLQALLINVSSNGRHTVVHQITLPLQESYFVDHLWDDPEYEPSLRSRLHRLVKRSDADAQIWSGKGILTSLSTLNPCVQLDCILRNKKDTRPFSLCANIFGKDDRNGDRENFRPDHAYASINGMKRRQFGFCKNIDYFDSVRDHTTYTREFAQVVFQWKTLLGLDA